MISRQLDISKDKTGWEISLRIFAIMCNIELLRLDEATMQVENLRKVIERNKEKEISARDRAVTGILKELSRKGFVFDQLSKKTLDALALLEGKNKDHQWQLFSAELIPFHQWMRSKMPERKRSAKRELVFHQQ